MKVFLKYRGRKLAIEPLEICNSLWKRSIGLMFSSKEKSKAKIFVFQNPTQMSIHSFFVFFPFFAVWIDENGKILDKRLVLPWMFSVKPKQPYTRLIEIPINAHYADICEILHRE
jgi:uncharacterized membrane protein (UPF0127 family)